MDNFVITFFKDYYLSFKGLSNSCWRGIMLSLAESILAGVYYFLSFYFVENLHFTVSTAGIIISFYGLGTIAGGFISGRLCDRISPINVIALGLILQAISFGFLIKLRTPIFLIINTFALGIGTYCFITSNYVWVLSQCSNCEPTKLKIISILNVASNLGIGISAIIIGTLATYGFKYIFCSSSILLSILALILLFSEQKISKKINIDNKNEQQIENEVLTSKTNKNNHTLYLVLICLFFTGMIVSQLNATYPIFLKNAFPDLGMNAYSSLFTLMTVLVVVFQNYVTFLFRDKNKLLMIGFGSFLIGLGMLLLNFSFIFPLAILACIIYSIGEMLFFSMVQLFCYQQWGVLKKGRGLGTYRMIYASSRFIGPAAGGYIFHNLGGAMVWYLSGAIGTFFLILCNFYKELN